MPPEKDSQPSDPQLVRFKIDGRELEAPPGTSVIRAAHEAGIEVPYFCYHPGLTPDGNCRMCLVEASNARKPVASCVTPVSEGLEITTDSEAIREARQGVLELMLVNHPLDCPICDKSGECLLQDNVYDHGPDNSRMQEPKELKPTKDLGSTIALWGNRCIVCTRCVRFCDEVSGSGELTIVQRGDHAVVDVFEEYPLENPLAMNTVDICPVGALISKEFLYGARVWNMKKTPSVCTSCSKGCSVEIQQENNEIKRIVPRYHPEVNGYWMCDHGREAHRATNSEERLLRCRLVAPGSGDVVTDPRQGAKVLTAGLRDIISGHGPEALAGVASAWMTNEELVLFQAILDRLGVERRGALARPVIEDQKLKAFTIPGDKNPNRAGVETFFARDAFESGLQSVVRGIESGDVRGALIVADLPESPLDEDFVALLNRLDFCAVLSIEPIDGLSSSVSLLPASAFGEKEGTLINDTSWLQRINSAVALPRKVRNEHELFQEILIELGERQRVLSSAAVFEELVAPALGELEGKTLRDVGERGLHLSSVKVTAPQPTKVG